MSRNATSVGTRQRGCDADEVQDAGVIVDASTRLQATARGEARRSRPAINVDDRFVEVEQEPHPGYVQALRDFNVEATSLADRYRLCRWRYLQEA